MTEPTFDSTGRMQYHPEYHSAHKRPWTNKEEAEVIRLYYTVGAEELSFSLGRTIATVQRRACNLRKAGKLKRPQTVKYVKHLITRNRHEQRNT